MKMSPTVNKLVPMLMFFVLTQAHAESPYFPAPPEFQNDREIVDHKGYAALEWAAADATFSEGLLHRSPSSFSMGYGGSMGSRCGRQSS